MTCSSGCNTQDLQEQRTKGGQTRPLSPLEQGLLASPTLGSGPPRGGPRSVRGARYPLLPHLKFRVPQNGATTAPPWTIWFRLLVLNATYRATSLPAPNTCLSPAKFPVPLGVLEQAQEDSRPGSQTAVPAPVGGGRWETRPGRG